MSDARRLAEVVFSSTQHLSESDLGMPPYGQLLNNDEIVAVATFIRQSWGNHAEPVSTLDVLRVK